MALLFGIILAGCSNSLEPAAPQSPAASAGAGAGKVVVRIAGNDARTLLPGAPEFSGYTLSFIPQLGEDKPADITLTPEDLAGGYTMELLAGNWKIGAAGLVRIEDVTGIDDGDYPAAYGESATLYIYAGATIDDVTIDIQGGVDAGGQGVFSYDITYQEDISSATLKLLTLEGDEAVPPIDLLDGGPTGSFALDAGYYLLRTELEWRGSSIVKTEVVHIYGGRTTEANYTFTEDGFIWVETLAPVYVAFTGPVGATLLPSNAAAITEATGDNTAVFAIVGGGMDVATIDSATGELTLVETGAITVSLVITTADGAPTHKGTSESITVTKEVTGAAITGLDGVLQVGETLTPTAVTTENDGAVVWTSSAPGVAAIDADTGDLTLVSAGDATISYIVMVGNVAASNSVGITVYGAAVTLTPVYAAFTGVAGAKATPTNAAAITEATGDNTAVFAIAAGAGAATINTGTGELTMGDGGAITVSLTINTESGLVTHKGTSAYITVRKLLPHAFTVPDPKTENGVTATVIFDKAGSQILGTAVTATVTLSGTVGSTGTYTIVLSSSKAGLAVRPKARWIKISTAATDTWTFSFTMPDEDVDDFDFTLSFAALENALNAATIADSGALAAYINTNCAGGTADNPKIMPFTGAINNELYVVRDAVNTAGTYVIWDLSEVTGVSAAGIGDELYYSNRPVSGSDKIKGLVLPDGLTSIDANAFYRCTSLTSVTIGAGVTSIGEAAFSGCSGLTSVTMRAGLTSIAYRAFFDCSGLTSVTIPEGVTSIVNCAFENCSGLTSVTIGDGVISIGQYAFGGCSGLTSVTIPDGVTSIGDEAFSNCSGLTSVTIGAGVTSIVYRAFGNCSGLTSVTIPANVTSIEDSAFGNCSALTSVTFETGSDITSAWNNYAFSHYSSGYVYTGNSLWAAYATGSKAGTYTRSGNEWTQVE
jgi:hypothetical protein